MIHTLAVIYLIAFGITILLHFTADGGRPEAGTLSRLGSLVCAVTAVWLCIDVLT